MEKPRDPAKDKEAIQQRALTFSHLVYKTSGSGSFTRELYADWRKMGDGDFKTALIQALGAGHHDEDYATRFCIWLCARHPQLLQ